MSVTAGEATRARPDGRARVRRRHLSSFDRREARAGRLLVAPAFAFVAVFVLFPLGFAVYISLTDWPVIGDYHWVGLDNYSSLAKNTIFLQSLLFTLEYTAIVTGPIFFLGYGLALLVRANRFGSAFFRTMFFLPFVVGLATESFMLVLELQPGSGAINFLAKELKLADGNTAWLVHKGLALAAVCVLVTWFASGLTMMLLMSGMQGIPSDIYGAAKVDGATWWDRELRITLPLLKRTIALSLIISVIGSFLAFNQFYILTQGGPGTSTATVVLWIWQTAFTQLHLGQATAMAIVLVIVVAIISAFQFLLLRSDDV